MFQRGFIGSRCDFYGVLRVFKRIIKALQETLEGFRWFQRGLEVLLLALFMRLSALDWFISEQVGNSSQRFQVIFKQVSEMFLMNQRKCAFFFFAPSRPRSVCVKTAKNRFH